MDLLYIVFFKRFFILIDDDDDYDEELFEESSPKKSPQKSVQISNQVEADDDDDLFGDFEDEEANDPTAQQGQEDEEENQNFEEGMNLDDFLKQFNDEEKTEEEKKTAQEDPSMRPLVGFSPPAKKDARDEYLSMKLNHKGMNNSPNSQLLSPSGHMVASLSHSSNSVGSKNSNSSGPTNDLNISPQQKLQQVVRVEEENAARVDALLKKLNVKQVIEDITTESSVNVDYPVGKDSTSNLANNYKHPKPGDKEKKHEMLPLYHKYNAGAPGISPGKTESNQNSGNNTNAVIKDVNMLTSQISKMRQDMKRKDDRLGRVVEHDTLIQNKCDALTREVAYLKQCLHDTTLEAQAQMARADNAITNSKKKKKAVKVNTKLEEEVKALKEGTEILVGRETALLDAVREQQ